MADVNEELTRKVAELARLELSEAEVRAFTGQLNDILKYVDQLSELDLIDSSGVEVEPMTHPHGVKAATRADEIVPSPLAADGSPKMLGPAPESEDGGFKVPPIL